MLCAEDIGFDFSWDRCERESLCEVQLIIRAENDAILAARGDLGPRRLPGFLSESLSLDEVNVYAQDVLKFDKPLIIYRTVYGEEREFGPERSMTLLDRVIYDVGCEEGSLHVPSQYEWVPCSETTIHYSEPEGSRFIAKHLHEIANGVTPAKRVDWARGGWFESAQRWMQSNLWSHGIEIVGRVEQIRLSNCSTVLRAHTTADDYYLKCHARFLSEVNVTEVLADIAPKMVERPLAVDKGKRMMLTRDHGEELGVRYVSHTVGILRALCRLHKASMGHIWRLESAGLRKFDADWMEDNLDRLFQNRHLTIFDGTDDWQKLVNGKGKIIDALATLRMSRVPVSVVHGDTFLGNVYQVDGEYRFFDFASSYIAHPLFEFTDLCDETVQVYARELGYEELLECGDLRSVVGSLEDLIDLFRYVEEAENAEESDLVELRSHLEYKYKHGQSGAAPSCSVM